MAIHAHLWDLAQEAVDEYLLTIKGCLAHRKPDGGCLGFPSTLLMLCLIDAFGTYLRGDEVVIEGKHHKITLSEPFRALNHPLFALNLTSRQIKIIEKAYRNRLAHNAMIDTNSWLIPGTGEAPFLFKDDQVGILVFRLYELLEAAWKIFDRSRIKSFVETLPGYKR
jgi:hypothetical protein